MPNHTQMVPLSRVGGETFVKHTNNILSKLMINEVAKQFRNTGATGKNEFQNLELRKLITGE